MGKIIQNTKQNTNPLIRYYLSFIKNDKVKETHVLYSIEQVQVFTAIARNKGCEVEVYGIENQEKKSSNNNININSIIDTKKKDWNKTIRCVETGQIFPTIRDCSNKTGIPYMTIYNCVNNKNATRGLHFVLCEDEDGEVLVNNREGKELPNYRKKILCTTTGELFESVTKVFETYPQIPLNSFYYNMRRNKPVKGLMFEYV